MKSETYTLGKQMISAIKDKKLLSIEALDVQELTPLAELFIIVIASNIKQTRAIADEVEEKLALEHHYPVHKEGYQSANWILLDYGDIIVHILEEESATFYSLSRLWQDAKKIEFK